MTPTRLPESRERPTRAEIRRRQRRIENAVIAVLLAVCGVAAAFLIGG